MLLHVSVVLSLSPPLLGHLDCFQFFFFFFAITNKATGNTVCKSFYEHIFFLFSWVISWHGMTGSYGGYRFNVSGNWQTVSFCVITSLY